MEHLTKKAMNKFSFLFNVDLEILKQTHENLFNTEYEKASNDVYNNYYNCTEDFANNLIIDIIIKNCILPITNNQDLYKFYNNIVEYEKNEYKKLNNTTHNKREIMGVCFRCQQKFYNDSNIILDENENAICPNCNREIFFIEKGELNNA